MSESERRGLKILHRPRRKGEIINLKERKRPEIVEEVLSVLFLWLNIRRLRLSSAVRQPPKISTRSVGERNQSGGATAHLVVLLDTE